MPEGLKRAALSGRLAGTSFDSDDTPRGERDTVTHPFAHAAALRKPSGSLESPASASASSNLDMESSRFPGLRIDVPAPPPHHVHFPSHLQSTRPSSHGSMSELGYGWFDMDDQLSAIEGSGAKPAADHMSVLNRIESLRELDLSARADTPSSARRKAVLFNLSQKNFTVTTKVFEDYSTSRSYFLALGLGGFRIIQGPQGEHAEFNLIVCMNSQTYCIWKRYSQFSTLVRYARRCHSRGQLRRTLEAWGNLEQRRKWWRCLDVRYLAQKYSLLELFLKELVYEIKSPALLVKFSSGKLDADGEWCLLWLGGLLGLF